MARCTVYLCCLVLLGNEYWAMVYILALSVRIGHGLAHPNELMSLDTDAH